MTRNQYLVSLEIGTHKLCAAVGEVAGDEPLRVLAVAETKSCGVRKSEVTDKGAVTKCIEEVVQMAEEQSDVDVNAVYMAVTGAHFESLSFSEKQSIPETREEVIQEDLDQLRELAQKHPVPPDNGILHDIVQFYCVDGQEGVLDPLGRSAKEIAAHYHVIYGMEVRIRSHTRIVEECGLEVADAVFAPYAAAQAALTQVQKNDGVLMIDLGAGTSGYILYVDGAVMESGVLAVGGDHVTNDIATGLRIPRAKAERLKEDEGCCVLRTTKPGDKVKLPDETGFIGRDVDRHTLNQIIHLRMHETLSIIRSRVAQLTSKYDLSLLNAGVVLTGGGALMEGIEELAEEVFKLPTSQGRAEGFQGITRALEQPQYSTVIGLLEYARHNLEPGGGGGFWDYFFGKR